MSASPPDVSDRNPSMQLTGSPMAALRAGVKPVSSRLCPCKPATAATLAAGTVRRHPGASPGSAITRGSLQERNEFSEVNRLQKPLLEHAVRELVAVEFESRQGRATNRRSAGQGPQVPGELEAGHVR